MRAACRSSRWRNAGMPAIRHASSRGSRARAEPAGVMDLEQRCAHRREQHDGISPAARRLSSSSKAATRAGRSWRRRGPSRPSRPGRRRPSGRRPPARSASTLRRRRPASPPRPSGCRSPGRPARPGDSPRRLELGVATRARRTAISQATTFGRLLLGQGIAIDREPDLVHQLREVGGRCPLLHLEEQGPRGARAAPRKPRGPCDAWSRTCRPPRRSPVGGG